MSYSDNTLTTELRPLTIKDSAVLDEVKEIMKYALAVGRFDAVVIGDIISWLRAKELKALWCTSVPLVGRGVYFGGFFRARTVRGRCKVNKNEDVNAKITLSKHIIYKGNEDEILNVMAHEVLHSILPFDEGHKGEFKYAMNFLNKELQLHMDVKKQIQSYEREGAKYEAFCPHCHCVLAKYYRAGNVVKHPNWYVCKTCGTELGVREIKN